MMRPLLVQRRVIPDRPIVETNLIGPGVASHHAVVEHHRVARPVDAQHDVVAAVRQGYREVARGDARAELYRVDVAAAAPIEDAILTVAEIEEIRIVAV